MALSLFAIGCATAPAAPAKSVETKTDATLTCPGSTDASVDLASAFGVSRDLGARLERMMRLATELERTVAALDVQTREVCSAIATDLDPAPLAAGSSPCDAARERWESFRRRLGADARVAVKITDVSCTITRDTLAKCAGECVTGVTGVESAVSCTAKNNELGTPMQGVCRGAFEFPNASSTCATQCSARALRLGSCSAQVDVRIEGTTLPVAPVVDGLRRDLPKLAGLAGEALPAAQKLGKDVATLVDDLAVAIDALTRGGDLDERKVVTGVVIAGCFAPKLAGALRASAELERTVGGAAKLQSSIALR